MKLLITLTFLFGLLASVIMIEHSKSGMVFIANVQVDESVVKTSKIELGHSAWMERCTYKEDRIRDLAKVKLVRQKSLRTANVDRGILNCIQCVNRVIDTFEKRHNNVGKKIPNGIYDIGLYNKDIAQFVIEANILSDIYISTTEGAKRTQIENICEDIFTNMAIMRSSIYIHTWIPKATAAVTGIAGAFIGGPPGAAFGTGMGYLVGKSFIRKDQ
ncbi:uncharacterized protein LOC116349309 [Contarinia nasturtii]|uniref:uncharacterized protein LOC116349309 n=1 Tax=Contarinia nasturtii TaxID=265458 RepID=UPI0012D40C7B|nr:uncharacterized protein LOC116349309 [Contarinia nasturtii]